MYGSQILVKKKKTDCLPVGLYTQVSNLLQESMFLNILLQANKRFLKIIFKKYILG